MGRERIRELTQSHLCGRRAKKMRCPGEYVSLWIGHEENHLKKGGNENRGEESRRGKDRRG